MIRRCEHPVWGGLEDYANLFIGRRQITNDTGALLVCEVVGSCDCGAMLYRAPARNHHDDVRVELGRKVHHHLEVGK